MTDSTTITIESLQAAVEKNPYLTVKRFLADLEVRDELYLFGERMERVGTDCYRLRSYTIEKRLSAVARPPIWVWEAKRWEVSIGLGSTPQECVADIEQWVKG